MKKDYIERELKGLGIGKTCGVTPAARQALDLVILEALAVAREHLEAVRRGRRAYYQSRFKGKVEA